MLQGFTLPNFPIQLGNGWTLTPPAAGNTGVAIPPANAPAQDPLAAALQQFGPVLGQAASAAATATGNPLISVGVSALGVLFDHLLATQTQMAAEQANGRPVDVLQSLEASLKTQIRGLLGPFMPAAMAAAAAAHN